MKITIKKIETPMSTMTMGSTGKGICMLEFTQDRVDQHFKGDFSLVEGNDKHLKQLESEVREYFEGNRTEFDVNLDLIGTDFQKKVWKELLNIPYGKTSSYLEQAKAIGDPKAIRAMASANGKNKVSIVVPCHRVIGSDGSLIGYGGGIKNKRFLLELESKQLSLF